MKENGILLMKSRITIWGKHTDKSKTQQSLLEYLFEINKKKSNIGAFAQQFQK